MIHSTITRRITICIFIFGREGSTNIVWKRIYAWTCKFTYKPKKKKKKRIVSRVLRERWLSLWPQFLTLYILIQFELPLSFFRWSIPGGSRNNQSYVANSTHVGIGFFNFCPRRVKATHWGNEITVLQENHGRDRGYLYKTLKRTFKPSRFDIFVIKQINTLHKD